MVTFKRGSDQNYLGYSNKTQITFLYLGLCDSDSPPLEWKARQGRWKVMGCGIIWKCSPDDSNMYGSSHLCWEPLAITLNLGGVKKYQCPDWISFQWKYSLWVWESGRYRYLKSPLEIILHPILRTKVCANYSRSI